MGGKNRAMNPPRRALAAIFLALFAGLSSTIARGDSAVDVQVGSATVEAAAVNDGAFRLTVSYDGAPRAADSVYLSGDSSPASFTTINKNGWTGVKNAAGELLIDQADGQWMLRDSHGRTLIPAGPIAQSTKNVQTGKPFVILYAGCAFDRKFEVYGCGDGADALLQDHADPGVGNGHAVTPYYWSRAGYAALGVSSNDNAPPAWWASSDLGRITWTFSGNSADLYLMPANSLEEASRAYAKLSGPPAVPPRWTFGYLQSRWGWKDRAYIDDVLHQFISRKLPVDAFIFDFEWYTNSPDYTVKSDGLPNWKDFSFNPKLFPDPSGQIAAMKANGVHFVGIRKPRLGNSDLLKMARSGGWILAPGSSGERIDTRCLNFANPAVRDWYADQMIPLLRQGIDGWWDDEGEITYTDYYWWNRAEAQALAQVRPDARLWTIDRAFAPGLQRFGIAAWTGDIHATWAELAATPTHLLNWSLAGMPYGACDIGGFSGETTPQLLTRWMEAGVFFPIMRTHSVDNVTPHFPWLFGEDAESAMRKALDLRYRLIPYYYSLAHEAHETGVPIMRPLAMEFSDDWRCANISDEWLMGPGLLAAPILDDTQSRRAYLPRDTWFKLGDGTPIEGGHRIDVTARLDEIPVYVRAGTVLPMGPIIQHTDDLPGGPLEVQVYPGKDGKFTLVEDDGVTTDYLKGQVRRTTFTWNDAARKLSWKTDGPYAGGDVFTDINISVMDADGIKTAAASLGSGGERVIGK
jgi:alpha-glucosidase